jgi:hyperosmotically inducible protein
MKTRFSFVSIAVVLLSLSASALAQDRRDLRIADEVARQVTTYPRFTIFDDVSGTVENGIVTLTGKVTMPFKKDEIGKRVAAIDGVRELQNQIEVLPVSSYDDDLRRRIARAIYSNPSFWNYAASANPPIHIVVDRGRVTLTGVVHSNVERMLALSLASGWGEFSLVNELRTEAEMRSLRSLIQE